MFPVTEDKFLLKFVGKTLLEHRIEQALAVGLSNIILVGNHQNVERLEGIARRFSQAHIALTSQGESSGMADALMSAQHLVEDEIIVVSPGDVFDESGYCNVLVEKNRGLASSFILGAKVASKGSDAYERVLQSMVDDGYKMKLVEYSDFWSPIKYPWHILKAMEYFLDKTPGSIAPSATVSDTAIIDGSVILDEDVRVLENAV